MKLFHWSKSLLNILLKETKIKLEDVSIGMEVVDKLGNEYVIIALDRSRMPVRLRCIKHNKICYVDEQTRFYGVGDEWWIVDSEEEYNEFANYDVDISLESINMK